MNRSDLAALQTFVAIAKLGSLRAAARSIGVNPPAVSHQLKAFENRLGTTLFFRSTRSIALTDAGRTLLESSTHLLDALSENLEAVRDAQSAATGRLRLTLPFRAWQIVLAPRFAQFTVSHPGIELDLTVDEALSDIVRHGFHAGIRLGDHLQENMVAVRLTRTEETVLVASPDYVARKGLPAEASDLLHHDCIRHRAISSGRIAGWPLKTSDGEILVEDAGRLVFNDLRAVVDAAKRGFGIGWSLKRGVQRELDNGSLVEVLPGWTTPRPGFHLYYPENLRDSGLLRAFISHFRYP